MHVLQVQESSEPPPPPTEGGEGIVGALMMVMQKRSKVIHSSGKRQQTFNRIYLDRKKLLHGCVCLLLQTKVKRREDSTRMMTTNGMTDEALVSADSELIRD